MESRHFIALDSLRGICASIVAIFHVDGDLYIKSIPFVANGFLFVDFFFVLSGFVIAASYRQKIIEGFPIGKFMFLRWGRLYPLHAFMLLAYLSVALYKLSYGQAAPYSMSEFIGSALLLQAFEPHFGLDMNHWNPPSWSISSEFWTYLIFALTLRFSGRNYLAAFYAFIALTTPILLFGSERGMNVCFTGAGIARCLFGFSFGVVAYQTWQRGLFDGLKRSYLIASVVEVAALAACLAIVSYTGSSRTGLLCPPIFAVTVVVIAHQAGAASRLLLTSPLIFVGTLSYSIYMTHEFVLARLLNAMSWLSKQLSLPILIDGFAITNAPGHVLWSDLAVIPFCGAVLCISWMTFRTIENPGRLWSREIVSSSRKKFAY